MPLGKRLSRVFRKDSNHTIIPGNQQTTPTLFIPPTIEEDESQAIIAATSASLQDQNARLQAQSLQDSSYTSQLEGEITRLESLLSSRNAENDSALSQLQESNSAAVSQLNERLQTTSTQLQSLREQHTLLERDNTALQDQYRGLQTTSIQLQSLREQHALLERENTALQDDYRGLQASNQEYQAWVGRVQENFADQSRKIQQQEHRLVLALEPMDQASQVLYHDRVKLLRAREELEATFIAEKRAAAREIEELKNSLMSKEQDRTNLQSQFSLVQSQLDEEQAKNEDAQLIIQAVGVDRDSMIEELEGLKSSQSRVHSLFGGTLTPRLILVLRAFSRRFPRLGNDEISGSPRFLQTYMAEDLGSSLFDLPLDKGRLDTFLDSITPGNPAAATLQGLSFLECPACKIFKFVVRQPNARNRRLNEFPTRFRQTSCCSKTICSTCLTASLKKSLAEDWWYELGSQSWMKCPIEGCGLPIGIRRVDEITNILQDAGEQDTRQYISMFERAHSLRQSLAGLNPRTSREALSISSSLHKQLFLFEVMYDFFSDRFSNNEPDENGRIRAFDPGKIFMGSLDRSGFSIPIFTKFFRRSTTPKDCSVCAESLYEINFGSEGQWRQSCEGYYGSWMSQVLLFPTREVLRCDHDMDICKGCLETQISTQLEQFGRNGCGRLTCPMCNRVLSDSEVRCFGAAETVQTYERYLTLNHLSSEPNFRWCLRTECENGQLYENTEYLDPHIMCDECAFEMCFTHQIPWHEGLSCDQFDSQREHGDPEYQQTQGWLRTNSKNCPSATCGVNIEKDAGCFHMTCRACRHEFCWECLASWNLINPSPGRYVQNAHNIGCWFRGNNLQPTQIMGDDLQEALRRRGGT